MRSFLFYSTLLPSNSVNVEFRETILPIPSNLGILSSRIIR